MKKVMLILMAVIALCSCNKDDKQTAGPLDFNLGDTVVVAMKEVKYNLTEDITIQFDSVVSDSRCPANADCIWEGNAEAQFIFTKNKSASKFILNTHSSFTTDTIISGYHIKLVQLDPYVLDINHLPKQSDYKATIIIKK